MQITTNRLDFVTIEGLLAYAEEFAGHSAAADVQLPSHVQAGGRAKRAQMAMDSLRGFVQDAQQGFPGAAAYRSARRTVIEDVCAGDELVFYAAWNRLLAEGGLQSLLRAPIGSVLKPAHRRPVAIVPRAQLTPQLAEGRIVLDLAMTDSGSCRGIWRIGRCSLRCVMASRAWRARPTVSAAGWPISSTRNEAFHEPMPSGPPWRGW